MSRIEAVDVELSVVLGAARIAMRALLRLGRGEVLELDARPDDEVWILANEQPIARGEVSVEGDRIKVTITRPATAADYPASAR
jgi:flagellar motor switch protein FliN